MGQEVIGPPTATFCDYCGVHHFPVESHAQSANQPELPPAIEDALLRVRRMFAHKNTGYRGAAREWYANFVTSTPVARKLVTPIGYCLILAAKQDDAAFNALAKKDWPVFEERALDGSVYRVIALALRVEGLE